MADEKKNEVDADALRLLEIASRQFEEYLKITASAEVFVAPQQDAPLKQDWTHPMGLVLASSR